jgi:carotenoid 1,2-hydratase
VSDCQQYGITIIAFIGSVFSPYYAWSGRGDPSNHCAFNVALYGRQGHRWAMTERGAASLTREPTHLAIGPSALTWTGDCLEIDVNEIAVPHMSPIRGKIRLHPAAISMEAFDIDPAGAHRWWPVFPIARVEVQLDRPNVSWSGAGYCDTNVGSGPLEETFVRWDWSRAALKKGTAILYNVVPREGDPLSLALRLDQHGGIEPVAPAAEVKLPTTFWRVTRTTHADTADGVGNVETLEDSPFYARSMLEARLFGEDTIGMHESLMLDRFRMPIVKAMLPFRMPRRRK